MRPPLHFASALIAIGAGLLLALPGPARARAHPRANLVKIEREVMCPTCGTPLLVADSPLADRERQFIEQRIARGETKAQIERDLVAQFGPGILATPPDQGFDLSAYFAPIGAGALALVLLVISLHRWRRRSQRATPGEARQLPPPVDQRLDEDLTRYDL